MVKSYQMIKERGRELYKSNINSIMEKTCPSVNTLVSFIHEEMYNSKINKGIIGLSGGIDSSVVADLTVRAIGPENTYGVILPSSCNPSIDQEYAEKLSSNLKISYDVIPIKGIETAFREVSGYFKTDLQKGNMHARTRMALLYDKAADIKGRVFGTSNWSEYMIGYFTKHGDGAGDIEPILPLYKTQVRKIARELDIPKEIIERKSSAGLWEGQTDEKELGIDYETLDKILLGNELGFRSEEISEIQNIPSEQVNRIFNIIETSNHKRNFPPSLPQKFYNGGEK